MPTTCLWAKLQSTKFIMNLPPDDGAVGVGVGVELAEGEAEIVGDADGLAVATIFNLVIVMTALSAA